MKVAIISDTHGLLRKEVIEYLKSCQIIVHAGDIGTEEVYQTLLRMDASVYMVKGNNDCGYWADRLPEYLSFQVEGITFFMTHQIEDVPKEVKADVIITGHSHQFAEIKRSDSWWINPGSCGKKRFHLPLTMALLEWQKGIMKLEKIELAP